MADNNAINFILFLLEFSLRMKSGEGSVLLIFKDSQLAI